MGSNVSVEQVQAEVTKWVAENWDPDIAVGDWWKRLAAAGLTSPMLPEALGGRDYPRDLAIAVSQSLAKAGVVGPPFGLGMMLAAPTIAVHGTPEQQAHLLPRILDGTDAWCQLFSEPGAGSDLAGLQTKAERDGDEWVITGQKVWTSGGQHADLAMLLARTNPDAPKHQGITYFVFDMHQPGVEVRPLREMTGHSMFNEVFLDEARVPHANILGGLNNGWAVANTTLMVERASIGSGGNSGLTLVLPGSVAANHAKRVGSFVEESAVPSPAMVGRATVEGLAAVARAQGRATDPIVRQQLAELYTLVELNRLNVLRARSGQGRTGGEGNLAKLLLTHTLRRTREIGNHIIGADGMIRGRDTLGGGAVQELTLYSPGPSIYGGTDQIQRNIVGERVLGLPKEPGNEKRTPFSALLKN